MMDEWTAAFEGWMRANAAWVGPATFLVAFLESFPVVSIVVPSTALLLAIGALIGGGLADPWPVLAACALGGMLGDAAGYWLARAVGPYAVRRRLPASCRRVYAWSVTVFRRWGWWAVFAGRFLGPMRAVTPLAAGVTGMRNRAFQSANILSALLWAPLVLMPGSIGGWLARELGQEPDPLLLAATAGGALLLWLSYLRLRPVLSGALKARR
ncbi:putative membrane spanning protein [Roseomonas mucosa]|uniref:DedA family protein n=1 Tax=Roseomonas mucosa TaxID=207340 RepID=A0A1S8D857_9PROT|nr:MULTISPECIES: DedA family protein [Roseomonas]MBS5902968.1 DedA family protein [Acetobacteraceae bacterium]ATR22649.1 DedA family protein [Roseomonas sp. FDAARGOS_362]AWV24344.1 putative membrane spanning protein [Roseomonas mucosa]MCG7351021.1 DedA family protein [Roseomonas mucosa]MCG7356467.1 DedA family protein [Roseomonas mucosa]